MISIDISTKEKFLENRAPLVDVFKIAIREAMAQMGEDIQGVPWFNPRWDEYVKSCYQIAS
ncbi:MAG: hypothetical protein HQL98_14175 [Magnetococcales bacterium]|nr:hypothetical protein [Magnetococcales bacterium]